MIQRQLLFSILVLLSTPGAFLRAVETNSLVSAWAAAQTNIHSWSADFVQTRNLKSLAQPLTAEGHIWFAAPNQFHWELGHPPQTIAVRTPTELLVIYPRLKRAEHFPLNGAQTGPWRDALALLEAGFPRSQEELQAQYNIISEKINGGICAVTLQPKSASARRMMPQIKIDFDIKDFSLRGTELEFADGSTLRNDFKNPEINPTLDEKLFAPEIPPDYKNIEPLKSRQGGL
jgi:outer membrane lipoprotein-sorting protein